MSLYSNFHYRYFHFNDGVTWKAIPDDEKDELQILNGLMDNVIPEGFYDENGVAVGMPPFPVNIYIFCSFRNAFTSPVSQVITEKCYFVYSFET